MSQWYVLLFFNIICSFTWISMSCFKTLLSCRQKQKLALAITALLTWNVLMTDTHRLFSSLTWKSSLNQILLYEGQIFFLISLISMQAQEKSKQNKKIRWKKEIMTWHSKEWSLKSAKCLNTVSQWNCTIISVMLRTGSETWFHSNSIWC